MGEDLAMPCLNLMPDFEMITIRSFQFGLKLANGRGHNSDKMENEQNIVRLEDGSKTGNADTIKFTRICGRSALLGKCNAIFGDFPLSAV